MFDHTMIKMGIENREGFDNLFRHYYPRLKSYVSSFVEDSVAEDITQDVFLYVWENRKKIYVGPAFHSYLFQAGYTRSIDYLKRQQSVTGFSSLIQNEITQIYETLAVNEGDILENLYSEDFYEKLYTLLELIPEQRRNVFLMAYMDGLKTKEIAANLDIPQRTVESHIYLTLKFLKEHFEKKDFFLLLLLIQFSI
ncbi:MAG: RNA polymerase sigma-70 factor [Parabacteroides sp.]|nr:RNA polymerase sigma-70 factor [Parabacteroides sp.]